jgi:hypothetical protein
VLAKALFLHLKTTKMAKPKYYLDLGDQVKQIVKNDEYTAYELDYCVYLKCKDGRKFLYFNSDFMKVQVKNWFKSSMYELYLNHIYLEHTFGKIHEDPDFQIGWINNIMKVKNTLLKDDVRYMKINIVGMDPSFWSASQFWYLVSKSDIPYFRAALKFAIKQIGGLDKAVNKLVDKLIEDGGFHRMQFFRVDSLKGPYHDHPKMVYISDLTDDFVSSHLVENLIKDNLLDKSLDIYAKDQIPLAECTL